MPPESREVTGRPPSPKELGILTKARTAATGMARTTETRMRQVVNLLLPGASPPLHPEPVKRWAGLFEKHFKSRAHSDALQIAESYKAILDSLEALTSASYRVVTDEEADRESDGDTYAFVYIPNPKVYVARKYFGELSTTTTGSSKGGGARVEVGERILTDHQKARVLVHEVAHFRIGVRHRGGRFGFDVDACEKGHAVRTFADAAGNAACYDLFAYCASKDP